MQSAITVTSMTTMNVNVIRLMVLWNVDWHNLIVVVVFGLLLGHWHRNGD